MIARFDASGNERINSLINLIDERVCRVPYCRVPDSERYAVDNLPYHLTVSSSKTSQKEIIEALKPLSFEPFEIVVDGVETMCGMRDSRVLYFKIQDSDKLNELLINAYDCLNNGKYLPGRTTPHITIAISRDYEKIQRIKFAVERNFSPFSIKIGSLGLYRIWPGELVWEL
ncbi:MAG: 2'-5' RNA ligase family protein [Paludibacteraceae bacterium]|nr:2'-5' RNA ligase family protein [Paludibacteraceae bacterium]